MNKLPNGPQGSRLLPNDIHLLYLTANWRTCFLMNSADNNLIDDLDKLIDERLDDPAFSIESICQNLGVSRSHLYRVLKEETNLSTSRYLQKRRLLVVAASVSEKAGAKLLIEKIWANSMLKELCGKIEIVWADGGYQGDDLYDWVANLTGWLWEVVKRSDKLTSNSHCDLIYSI